MTRSAEDFPAVIFSISASTSACTLGLSRSVAGAERLGLQELAFGRVPRRIHLREDLVISADEGKRGGLRRIGGARCVRAQPRVHQQRADILVARDEPGRRAVPLGDTADPLLGSPCRVLARRMRRVCLGAGKRRELSSGQDAACGEVEGINDPGNATRANLVKDASLI